MGAGDDVDEVILRPMQAVYPCPQHLRADPAARALALATYRRGLARYDRPALEYAWQRAAEGNEFWTWPKLADFVRACEHHRAAVAPRPAPDGARVERANELAWAYTRRFMATSGVARRAKAEGWEGPLGRYVFEAAWVQGQMIAGCSPVGYAACLLTADPRVAADELRERKEAFLGRAREQAAKGHVRVHVPHAAVERWRRGVAGREGDGPASGPG